MAANIKLSNANIYRFSNDIHVQRSIVVRFNSGKSAYSLFQYVYPHFTSPSSQVNSAEQRLHIPACLSSSNFRYIRF
jgi:hypothetical protein